MEVDISLTTKHQTVSDDTNLNLCAQMADFIG